MDSLGLLTKTKGQPPTTNPSVKKKKRRTTFHETDYALRPTRRSSRIATTPAHKKTDDLPVAVSSEPTVYGSVPTYVVEALRSDSEKKSSPHRFNETQTHQHVTVSKGGSIVATSGCAGYGGSLVEYDEGVQSWTVRCVRRGTGGFAVGVVNRKWKGPFKSLGKNPNSPGVYHSSGVLLVNKVEREFGQVYDQGDTIGVSVEKGKGNRRVEWRLNGEVVGDVEVDITTEFTLGVQPYMGGVAKLISNKR